jgi:hypothetical protein
MKNITMILIVFLSLVPMLSAHDVSLYGTEIPYKTVTDSHGCMALDRTETHLFAAGSSGILSIYDISKNPAEPRLVKQLNSLVGARQLTVEGNTLYITARNMGLWIIDISNPENPKILNRFDTIELATGISVIGNIAFVALRVYGVQVLDVSDPFNPKHLALLRTDEAQSVFYFDQHLAVGDWSSGRVVFADVSNPRHPSISSQIFMDGYGDGVDVCGKYCYAATGHHAKKSAPEERFGKGHGLEIFDISDIRRPEKMGVIKFPPMYNIYNDFWTPQVCGDTVFVVDTHNGMFMVDTSDKQQLKCLGHLQLPPAKQWNAFEQKTIEIADCAADIVLGDDVVYIAGQVSGLHVAHVPGKSCYSPVKRTPLTLTPIEPAKEIPGLTRYDLGGKVRRIAIDGDHAYIACSHQGLLLCQLEEKGNGLNILRRWEKDCSYDVCVRDGKLYSSEDTGNLVIYQIFDGGDLKEIGRYSPSHNEPPIQVIHLSSDGRTAICSGGFGRVDFIDVSDPVKPKLVFNHAHRGNQYSDTIPEQDINGITLAHSHEHGIAWYNLNGEKPSLLEEQWGKWGTDQLNGITNLGKNFIVPGRYGKYHLLNPADNGVKGMASPLTVSGDAPSGIPSWNGKNMVVFSCRRNGTVRAYDCTNPEHLTQIPERSYDLSSGTPNRVVFWRNRMLIPGGHAGLFVENLPPQN